MFALWKRHRHAAAVAPLMLAMVATASAQAPYPNRNITLVLPFAAGSGTDTTTRIISKELGTALGVSMVIDNKAGANGSIAASYAARSAPDGYTLFVTTNTFIGPLLQQQCSVGAIRRRGRRPPRCRRARGAAGSLPLARHAGQPLGRAASRPDRRVWGSRPVARSDRPGSSDLGSRGTGRSATSRTGP
jgi:hypothetical protein